MEANVLSKGVQPDGSVGVKDFSPEATVNAVGEQAVDVEALAKLAALRERLQARVGEVVLVMMNLQRYRNQTLADLMHPVLDPLTLERLVAS